MSFKTTVKIKVTGKTRIMQHAPGIAANRKLLAGFNKMMLIQYKRVRMMWYRAAVNYRLTVILARQFKLGQFE